MVGLHFSLGLATFTGYASSSKEFHFLLCAFAGILMCKLVYQLTGVVSPLFFEGYAKLNNLEKLEWNNRGFSTFHALIVAAASLHLLLLSDLFVEGSHDELIIYRTSALANTILGISIGYFLSDLAMIIWNFPALGGLEYVLHHGLSMFSIFLSLASGQGQIYILMVLFSESTTPFVNFRWYLDIAGQKNSIIYICNGIALFLGWLVARILLFIYFFYHMFVHFEQVKKVFPLGFYSLLIVPPVLAMMNLLWFWKISKGMIKTLSKAKHSQ
ncbi:hypothetical protein F0562_021643 [Nyssa sinensis]|uniref:TLC domain-containing protein n=1 Tax=Nyssa sinensis TaxID=561372 RepID=A0A5J5BQZ0_9ASTE|nr:hypothetical protein F0562_021643 [Nyssa sinensis]